jgi:D-alanyl-D-alanine dipeptidase
VIGRARRLAVLGAALGTVLAGAVTGCGSPGPRPGSPPGTSAASNAGTAPQAVPSPSASAPGPLRSVDVPAPDGWVALSDVDPSILQDVRYAGSHNFVGRPVDGYWEAECLLPEQTARALHRVQLAAVVEGYSLKVYDCYRPMRAGRDFVAWSHDPSQQGTRAEFYPGLTQADLFRQGFVAGGASSHSSGSAVDVTLVALPAAGQPAWAPGQALVPCTAPVGERFPDNSIDMGTGYDCFDARSHTLDAGISGAARENRLTLRRLMAVGGFVNYANEWWHYDLADPPLAGQYFDFPVTRDALR